jgi:hypothetical protein
LEQEQSVTAHWPVNEQRSSANEQLKSGKRKEAETNGPKPVNDQRPTVNDEPKRGNRKVAETNKVKARQPSTVICQLVLKGATQKNKQ